MRFLTVEQIKLLGDSAEDIQAGAGTLITVAAWTGLRWGEMVALRRASLDMLRRQVHVREAVTEISGRLVSGTPKNGESRTLILPRGITEFLAAHLDSGDSDLVFPAPRGGHLRSANFRKAVWLPALKTVTETFPDMNGLRIHDLRHTAASLAISTGANIKAVQRTLGHQHASMTLDQYGHLYTEDLNDLADRLDRKFRGAA